MKVVEFKFNRVIHSSFNGIREGYTSTIQRYLLEVFGIKDEINLEFFNLNRMYYDSNTLKYESIPGEYSSISNIMPYFNNTDVLCTFKDSGMTLFSFSIYGQNNCCGACSVSKTFVNINYRDRKLATILQYLKEDMAYYKPVWLMTCTDVYSQSFYKGDNNSIEDLKPYLPNTKVLLNTGWKVSKLFNNINSHNVVALFTKDLKAKSLVNIEVIMKIRIDEDKLVEIKNVTIGADPELFLRSKDNKEFVPSFFVMSGNKNKPTKISEDGHNIQCDNVMVEYGIPASKDAKTFVKHNLFVQDYIKNKIAEPNNLELVVFPFAEFTEANLMAPKAKEFGKSLPL